MRYKCVPPAVLAICPIRNESKQYNFQVSNIWYVLQGILYTLYFQFHCVCLPDLPLFIANVAFNLPLSPFSNPCVPLDALPCSAKASRMSPTMSSCALTADANALRGSGTLGKRVSYGAGVGPTKRRRAEKERNKSMKTVQATVQVSRVKQTR